MIGHLRRRSTAIVLVLALPALLGAVDPRVLEAINRTCVPRSQLQLAGLRLGDSRATVESQLGLPSGETAPGASERLRYPGLRVRLHASRVQSVRADSSRWSTPGGIRPGLSVPQVEAILGFPLDSIRSPHGKSADGYRVHRCIGEDEQVDVEQYLGLETGSEGAIVAVEIFWVSP